MLRPRQKESLDAIKKSYLQGSHRQVVSACTGFGKSVVLSHIPETMKSELTGQMLVLVHREELINQNIDKLRKYNPDVKVGKEKASFVADVDSDIIVASVQTLGRKGTKRIDRFNWEAIDKIVTDECHHSTSDAYLNVYEKAKVLEKTTNKLHVGFTATPNRSDGTSLYKIYDTISFNYPLRMAVEEGWLVDVRGIRIQTGQDIDCVKTVKGDLDAEELAAVIDNLERNQLVVKSWIEYGQGRPTIGFTANIAHAQHLAEMFQNYGINAVAIWGDDPLRAHKLDEFRKGNITILLNCALLTEGFDMWQVSCILQTAPTKSSVKYTQEIGRATRLEEGCPNLLHVIEDCSMSSHKFKRDCLIIDFCDTSKRHSLTYLPSLMGLPASLDLHGKSLTGSIKLVEEMQKLHPNLDFSTLEDIDKIKAFCEQIDLFEVKVIKELEGKSELQWHSSITGGYLLMLPDKDFVRIEQDLLDNWHIKGYIRGKSYSGERDNMEAAFVASDKLVRDVAPDVLRVVLKEAPWHVMPPTDGQLKLLRKLMKGKVIPPNYTRGDASKKIGELLAGKGK